MKVLRPSAVCTHHRPPRCPLLSSARTSVPALPLLLRSPSVLSLYLPLCSVCLSWPPLPSLALFPWLPQRRSADPPESRAAVPLPPPPQRMRLTPPGLRPGFSSLECQWPLSLLLRGRGCLSILQNEWIRLKPRQRFTNPSLVWSGQIRGKFLGLTC